MNLQALVALQRQTILSGITKNYAYRIAALQKLKAAILQNEPAIEAALMADLAKSPYESCMTETYIVLEELNLFLKNLKKWMRPRKVGSPIALFPAKSYLSYEPFGVVLIMSPWNYPFQLAMNPLIAAIAAGNTVVLKPASYAPATSQIMKTILESCFEADYVATVLGGREENALLLEQRFDYIFFTGSTAVGKLVMEKASKNLTPISLELGGKSPCILDEDIDLRLAAKRIAFGKVVNAGQTCVAPDYLLLKASQKADFIRYFQAAITEFFGADPVNSLELPKIVNAHHHARLLGLLAGETIVVGGQHTETKIAPTLLDGITEQSKIMQEEIFGPLLPMLTYETLEDVVQIVRHQEKPLALYLFTRNPAVKQRILHDLSFGGATINDTLMHFASKELGFGGVGASGMGRYHGHDGFLTFSNRRGIVERGNRIDVPLRYHPYTEFKMKIVRKLMK